MDQSLSGGSGSPLRMTFTVICCRESSDMRRNYSMRFAATVGTDPTLLIPQRCCGIQSGSANSREPRGHEGDDQEEHGD